MRIAATALWRWLWYSRMTVLREDVPPGAMLRLHHVGVAVADLETAVAKYTQTFGYELHSAVIHDPHQTALVQFLKLPGDTVFLEFVTPDSDGSKLTNALKRGGGLNHLCYRTSDIDAACRHLRAEGLLLLQRPVAAVAFPSRRIAWLVGKDRILVELVEAGPPGQL
jgi:methylmalonyl-CoA/ethylmalonyl-CoA epimerase